MPRPPAIPTRTCTASGGFGLESNVDLGAIITITSSEPQLVWAPTGTPGASDPYTITIEPGAEMTWVLPCTDVVGWRKGGADVDVSDGKQSHYYDITVQRWKPPAVGTKPVLVGKAVPYPRVVVPQGDGDLDIDEYALYTGVSGATLSIPADLTQKVADAQAAASEASAALATWSASSDADVEDKVRNGPLTRAALTEQIEANFRAVSMDGTQGLPEPTGVGFEAVITSAGLDDLRFNGMSL